METVFKPIMDFIINFMDRMVAGVEAFASIAGHVKSVALAFASLPDKKVVKLVHGVESILHAASTVKNPGGAVKVIQAATNYQKEKAKADANNQAQIPDELVTLMRQGQGNAGGEVKVILELRDDLKSLIKEVQEGQFQSYAR
jgi:hypothetical protein